MADFYNPDFSGRPKKVKKESLASFFARGGKIKKTGTAEQKEFCQRTPSGWQKTKKYWWWT